MFLEKKEEKNGFNNYETDEESDVAQGPWGDDELTRLGLDEQKKEVLGLCRAVFIGPFR